MAFRRHILSLLLVRERLGGGLADGELAKEMTPPQPSPCQGMGQFLPQNKLATQPKI